MGRKKLVRKAEPKRGIAWPRWTGFRGMTLRNWLELLVVPLALVVIGLGFTMLQDARQQDLENRRAEAERKLAEQRAQDEALQAYLDQMSQLMLERKLLEAKHGDPVHTLAQARTSTVILRLDAEHNESVTRFLSNSGLAMRSDPSGALITGPAVGSIEASPRLLWGITLSHATLSNAQLSDADLNIADLRGADLSNAFLYHANLSVADLRGADLSNAFLYNANLSDAEMYSADLSKADLSKADLAGAKGITSEELEQQARSLEGATMPNGQKYEDWLKDKKAQGKNEKNE